MATEYNIPNLFLQAFGLKVRDAYNIEIEDKPKNPNGLFSGITTINSEQFTEMSAMGTPIIAPVNFVGGTYKVYNTKGEIVQTQKGDFRLPISTIVSITREKIVGVTKINGGHGTVKEIYGFDDWKITINGFFIEEKGQPQGFENFKDQEKELISWENLADSIKVLSPVFREKNINYITILSIAVEAMRGKPNIRQFTINALSDQPIELNIKSEI